MRCCPACQSTEVYEVAGGYLGQVYRCKKCGYRGSLIIECDETRDGSCSCLDDREERDERDDL